MALLLSHILLVFFPSDIKIKLKMIINLYNKIVNDEKLINKIEIYL